MNVAFPPAAPTPTASRLSRRCCRRRFEPQADSPGDPNTAATPTDKIRADLNLSLDGQRASYLALASLADELCAGRWVSTGGGGYSVRNVVPRAWTHLLGIVSGQPVVPNAPIPECWRAEMGESAPLTMSDGADASYRPFDGGFAPHSRVDQAILATRGQYFPSWVLIQACKQ